MPLFQVCVTYDKVQCEWVIDTQYYDVSNVDDIDYDDWEYETVRIYNWKTSGVFGPPEEYNWHVGGNSIWATDVVDMILDNYNQNGVNHNGERYVKTHYEILSETSGGKQHEEVYNLETYGVKSAMEFAGGFR